MVARVQEKTVHYSVVLIIVMQQIVGKLKQQIRDIVYNTNVVNVINKKIVVRIIAALITVLGVAVFQAKVEVVVIV
jgi:hypothetical protein